MAIALVGITLAVSTLVSSTLVGSMLVGIALAVSTLAGSMLVGSMLVGIALSAWRPSAAQWLPALSRQPRTLGRTQAVPARAGPCWHGCMRRYPCCAYAAARPCVRLSVRVCVHVCLSVRLAACCDE